MLPVQWLSAARDNLAAIVSHIAEYNPDAALSLQDDIEYSVSALPDHPYLYRRGRVPGTREMVVHPNYYVVYRVTLTEIQVLRVLHARQQYP